MSLLQMLLIWYNISPHFISPADTEVPGCMTDLAHLRDQPGQKVPH